MHRYLLLTIAFSASFILPCSSQSPYLSINAPGNFAKEDMASSYFNKVSKNYHINFQDANKIYRCIYDSNFVLLDQYTTSSDSITFSEKETQKIRFVAPLATRHGTYEIFTDKDDILIYKPDFNAKKDDLVASFKFNKKSGERIIALMPDDDDLKILTYAGETNAVNIYKWSPSDSLRTYSYPLPKTNLSKEEEKIYTKSCQIKLKNLSHLSSTRINSIESLPQNKSVFYAGNDIYILLEIPFSMGSFFMHIDMQKDSLSYRNFFLNSLLVNAGTNNAVMEYPASYIVDSLLIFKNSSQKRYKFLFYNLYTGELIKEYNVPIKDSINYLVHSAVTKKGTYGSRDQSKELSYKKGFANFHNLSLASYRNDSITLSLFNIEEIETIEGTLLSMATLPFGYMMNFYIGNLQLVPYLTSSRLSLIYAYSRFNIKTLTPSGEKDISTNLDDIFEIIKIKELKSNSSFFIQKNETVFIGLFNKDQKKFDIYKFGNSN